MIRQIVIVFVGFGDIVIQMDKEKHFKIVFGLLVMYLCLQ